MADISPEARESRLQEVNLGLQGWLQRVFHVRQAMQELFDLDGYGNFSGMQPWFLQVPEDMSLTARPLDGVVLHGEHYNPLIKVDDPRDGKIYDADSPFTGGARIAAHLSGVHTAEKGTRLDMSLHCLREATLGRTAILTSDIAEGVVIPAAEFARVELKVVDEPPIVTPSSVYAR